MNDDQTVLLTPRGQELLSRLAAERVGREGAGLALAERLRREYPAELVAVAMAQMELRRAAAAKFSRAADMLFTRAGYEQSSAQTVARYRAARLGDASRLADLCCGIGGDLIALAGAGAGAATVLAVDRDETHVRLALHNAAVYGGADKVRAVVADVRDVSLAGIDAIFIDPARRSGQGAASAPNAGRYKPGMSEPPLGWCTALTETVPAVCIKAAPGIPGDLIPARWEAEFIAESRDLKEAVLWSPALATAPPAERGSSRGPRRATVLMPAAAGDAPRTYTLTAREGAPVALREPGEYLLDPNPAVTRAGLVEDLARLLGEDTAKIDPQIAFLTLDRNVATPFARTLRVQHSAPWTEKSFAKRLRELDVGAIDIRRRGLAGDVDQIRRRMKLAGSKRATVVITRVNDKPWGLICAEPARLPAEGQPAVAFTRRRQGAP
jgi:THUMP domain-like/RNA cap guanine-N2 methyltransferase